MMHFWNYFVTAPHAVLAIPPLLIAAIMAAAGAVKGMTVDKNKEDRERKLAAETQRYSPWTGLKAGEIHQADPLGNAIQGGLSGYSFGQNMGIGTPSDGGNASALGNSAWAGLSQPQKLEVMRQQMQQFPGATTYTG